MQRALERDPTPLLVQPAVVPDGPPIEEDIAVAVQGIHSGRAGRPSGMRVDNLNIWLRKSTWEKKPDRTRWEEFVSMTQLTFQEGSVLAELTCTTMILPLKEKGEYRGIELVKAIWNMITNIMNN